jgi:hypothetical protein
MSTAAVDVATHIGATVAGFTYLTNVFDGPVRPVPAAPAKAVFVLATGGPPPEARIGETQADRFPALQIRTRGDKNDFAGGLADARAVRDAVHYAPLAGWVDVRVQETEPNYLGEDNNGHPEWSVNAELRITE